MVNFFSIFNLLLSHIVKLACSCTSWDSWIRSSESGRLTREPVRPPVLKKNYVFEIYELHTVWNVSSANLEAANWSRNSNRRAPPNFKEGESLKYVIKNDDELDTFGLNQLFSIWRIQVDGQQHVWLDASVWRIPVFRRSKRWREDCGRVEIYQVCIKNFLSNFKPVDLVQTRCSDAGHAGR